MRRAAAGWESGVCVYRHELSRQALWTLLLHVRIPLRPVLCALAAAGCWAAAACEVRVTMRLRRKN